MSASRDELIAAGAWRKPKSMVAQRESEIYLDAFLAHPSALVGVMAEAGILKAAVVEADDGSLLRIEDGKVSSEPDALLPDDVVLYRVVGDT